MNMILDNVSDEKSSDDLCEYRNDSDTVVENTKSTDVAEDNETILHYNFMETRDYLNQVRDAKRRCDFLERWIYLRLHDPDGSNFFDTDDLEKDLHSEKQALNDAKIDVTDLTALLDNVDQQTVITKRYVDLEPWEQIADEMQCSLRTVHKLHGKALPSLEKFIKQYALKKGTGMEDVRWRERMSHTPTRTDEGEEVQSC